MTTTAYEYAMPDIAAGSKRLVSWDCTRDLEDDELLTGTPGVTEQTTSGLTLTNKVINSAAVEIKGETAAIGKAVQFLLDASSAVVGTTYRVLVLVDTDANPAQRLAYLLRFRCI